MPFRNLPKEILRKFEEFLRRNLRILTFAQSSPLAQLEAVLGDNVTEEATPRHVRTPDDRPITSRRGNAASQATVNQGPLPNKVPSDADNRPSTALGSAGSLETYFADEMLRQQQQQHQQWLWQAQMPRDE